MEYMYHDPAIDFVDIDKSGCVIIDSLKDRLQIYSSYPSIVSIQYINNEIGTIQRIKEISEIVHEFGGVLHVDAVQAYPHMKIDVNDLGIDLMSVSGHKFNAPKGIGFLYVKDGIQINPLIYGSQENDLRGGTENVPYILGLAKAVELNLKKLDLDDDRLENKRDYFEKRLKEIGCKINSVADHRLQTIINFMLPPGNVGEYILYMLSFHGIYASAGSACNKNKQSYVLREIGLNTDEIQRSIRFSFDDGITFEQIDYVISVLTELIANNK